MLIPLSDNVDKEHLPITGFALIVLNAYVWIYTARLGFDDHTMRTTVQFFNDWGCVPTDLAQGKVVGLFTSMFVHGGFMHFLGNMIFLWTLMWSLEASLGWFRFAPLYIGSGLLSGVAQASMDFSSEIPCIGASGAISGLFGAYLFKFGMATKFKMLFFFIIRGFVFTMPAWLFGAFWLGMQYWGHFTSDPSEPGVGWMCHLSGFFIGMILCWMLDENDAQLEERAGELRIATAKERAAKEEFGSQPIQYNYALDDSEEVPENACVYCQSELSDDDMIAPTLYRCPNSSCGHLNILAATPEKVHQ